MSQLMKMAATIGRERYFRCPYHANVMKVFDTMSSKTVVTR